MSNRPPQSGLCLGHEGQYGADLKIEALSKVAAPSLFHSCEVRSHQHMLVTVWHRYRVKSGRFSWHFRTRNSGILWALPDPYPALTFPQSFPDGPYSRCTSQLQCHLPRVSLQPDRFALLCFCLWLGHGSLEPQAIAWCTWVCTAWRFLASKIVTTIDINQNKV